MKFFDRANCLASGVECWDFSGKKTGGSFAGLRILFPGTVNARLQLWYVSRKLEKYTIAHTIIVVRKFMCHAKQSSPQHSPPCFMAYVLTRSRSEYLHLENSFSANFRIAAGVNSKYWTQLIFKWASWIFERLNRIEFYVIPQCSLRIFSGHFRGARMFRRNGRPLKRDVDVPVQFRLPWRWLNH